MNQRQEQKTIRDSVLEKIRSGEVRKLPAYVFSARGALYILAIILVTAFLLYLVSFLIFALQISGLWDLPMFGAIGVELLLGNFPWLIVVLALLLIGVLEVLLSRYNFVYRRPLFYSAILISILVAFGSIAVRQTMMHEKILGRIERGGLEEMRPLYERYTDPNPDQFHPGTVLEIGTDGFTMEQRGRSTVYVKISPLTRMRQGFRIYPGGRLLVIGNVVNDSLEAEVIDNAPPSGRP